MILGICGLSALTACQNQAGQDDFLNETGNTINVNDQRAEIYNQEHDNVSEDFGYVRHQKSPIPGNNASANHYAAIDREQIADIIGKYCTEVPNVDDISTLVTDEEVLIVYETNSQDRNATADQVKRMAMSVVPRWYHVYVSDDTSLRKNVESWATLDSDSRNVEYGIDSLIQEMLDSPQGRKMNNGENANGEEQGELNDNSDRDDISERKKNNGNQMNNTNRTTNINNTRPNADEKINEYGGY